jgi:hypothetical protein
MTLLLVDIALAGPILGISQRQDNNLITGSIKY